jgi:hypothetical protein
MRYLVTISAIALLVACGGEPMPTRMALSSSFSPAGPGAAEPNLFSGKDGLVLMSWLEPVEEGGHALRVAARGDEGNWSSVREVARRKDFFVNWADFPSVVSLADGRWLAHWLQRNGSATYAYEVRLAESIDNGQTWSESVTPHTPGIQAEHGFVSVLPDAAGGASIFFLDGGEGIGRGGAAPAGDHEHGVAMSLSVNNWTATMSNATKTVLDRRVCDCCQTASALTSRGPVVVYRDRSESEIRDIAITRQVDGAWTEPMRVHADEWEINACPVNGPAIIAEGEMVAVAWFTGARDTAKVQVAFSTDAGATFGPPIRVDEGTPAGRVGLQWVRNDAMVSWLERGNGDTAFVRVRRVLRDGRVEAPMTVSRSSGARSSGFPRMTRIPGGVMLAWTEPGTPSNIRVATVTEVP